MADTHEKKVEKKVVKDQAHKPLAAKDLTDEIEKELATAKVAPVRKIESTVKERHEAASLGRRRPTDVGLLGPEDRSAVLTGRGERSSPTEKEEPKPAPKAETKPAQKKAVQAVDKPSPATTGEAGRGQAGRGQSVPGEAPPAGESGEVEGEIVEEPGEKEKAEKPKKKKGKERKPHIKPELSAEVVKAMALRKELKDKTPNFIRQEAYNYGRLGQNWRKPRGTHSKLRHHISYRINVVSIGYGGPNASKGLHPSGFREVLVHHPLDLDRVDPKTQAARIAHGVGVRKRVMIEQRAQRKGIRVLNEMQEE